MENYSGKNISVSLIFLFLLLTVLPLKLNASNKLDYQTVNTSMQVAYYERGRDYFRPGYVYHGPDNGTFWGKWHVYYQNGVRCLRKCLVDTWSRLPIRCDERCVY